MEIHSDSPSKLLRVCFRNSSQITVQFSQTIFLNKIYHNLLLKLPQSLLWKFTAIHRHNYLECVVEIHQPNYLECFVEIHRKSPSYILRPNPLIKFTAIYRRNYLECVEEIYHNSPSQLPRVCCRYAVYCEFTDMSFYIFYFRDPLQEG